MSRRAVLDWAMAPLWVLGFALAVAGSFLWVGIEFLLEVAGHDRRDLW